MEQVIEVASSSVEINILEQRTALVKQIYQEIWKREPTPNELGRALGELENGKSSNEVRTKVKALKSSVLLVFQQLTSQ
jgi:hypothetical protein